MCSCVVASPLLPAIEHYAGQVVYEAKTFVDKNKDAMLLDIMELWESSSLDLMKRIFLEDGMSFGSGKAMSQSNQFKTQVRCDFSLQGT
jgi:myosin heavy subunit